MNHNKMRFKWSYFALLMDQKQKDRKLFKDITYLEKNVLAK